MAEKKTRRATTIDERPLDVVLPNSITARDFVERFGEDNAKVMLKVGSYRHDRPRTADYFMDCVNVGICYDSFTTYLEHNGFTMTERELQTWVQDNFPLDFYDGDKSMYSVFKKTYIAYLETA